MLNVPNLKKGVRVDFDVIITIYSNSNSSDTHTHTHARTHTHTHTDRHTDRLFIVAHFIRLVCSRHLLFLHICFLMAYSFWPVFITQAKYGNADWQGSFEVYFMLSKMYRPSASGNLER